MGGAKKTRSLNASGVCEWDNYQFQRLLLEDYLHSQLDFSWVMRSSDCAEVAVGEGITDVFKLRVVKGVEGFRT